MRHKILPLMLLLALCAAASAQTYDVEGEAEAITLNEPLKPDKSYHYTASGAIDLTPGFDYSPKKGKMALFEIDPMGVYPPQGGVTGGTAANNTGGVVGSIGGTVSVSALGGAVYTIPVELPPGKDGMQPSLGIAYNSQAGNGLLGYGWSLNGLSAVTRCSRTIYHDMVKTSDAVDYENDRFLLDGQRLLSISSGKTYGQDGCEYRTEVDNISRVISYGGDGQNPVSFKVWTKDGHIIEYGVTPDSKLVHPDGGEAAMWMVSTISDYNGNYISYTYTTTGESCRIDHIDYTGCDGISPMYSVQFEYDEREDREFAYLHNQKIVSDVLLESISVNYKATNEELYRYTFAYDGLNPSEGRFYSRLLSVGLEQGDTKVNPTKIEWGELEQYCEGMSGYNGDFMALSFSGDFNGDGIDDIISVPYNTPNGSNWKCLYGNGDGTFSYTGVNYPDKIEDMQLGRMIPCDLNGDGLCDLLALYTYDYSGNGYNTGICIYAYISKSDGNGFTQLYIYNYITSANIQDCVQIGDYLGDGKADIMLISDRNNNGNTNGSYISLFSFDNEHNQFYSVFFELNVDRSCDGVMPCDFNGDGKMDVMLSDENGATIYTVSYDKKWRMDQLYSGGFPTKWHECFPGDFNGDGKTDFLVWTEDHGWQVSISKGDGFVNQWDVHVSQGFPTEKPPTNGTSFQNYILNSTFYGINVCDMDGDGKSDVVFVFDDKVTTYYSPVAFGKVSGSSCSFSRVKTIETTYSYESFQNYSGYNLVGKFFNDACCSLMLKPFIDITGTYSLKSFDSQHNQNSVTAITDGMGNSVSFGYDNLTNPEFYTISKGDRFVSATDRVRRQALPLKALRSMTSTNVSGASVTSVYSYEDMYVHMTGRGLLGFKKSTVTDVTSGIKTVCTNRYAGNNRITVPYLVPGSTATMLTSGKNEVVISVTDYTCVLKSGTPITGRIPPVSIQTMKTSVKENDIDGKPVSLRITEYTYDDLTDEHYGYNNVTGIINGYSTDQSCMYARYCPIWEEESITYKPAVTDNGRWLVSRVDKSTVTSHISMENQGASKIKSSTEYEYDPAHPHLLASERTNPGDNAGDEYAIETDYRYTFAGGNICKVVTTVSAPNDSGVKERTSAVEYSPEYQYRFATTTTNSLGHSATAVYDPKYGRKLSDTDCNGLTDGYTTDFFGTDSESVSPEGLTTHSSKRWCAGDEHAPKNAAYYTWTQSSGSYPVMTFYHKTGTPLREVSRGFDGSIVYVDMDYDAKGNLWRRSLPYLASGSADLYEVYTYDALNRIIKTEHPDGTWDEVEYSGSEVSTTHHDSSDRLQQTVTKRYHPNGWLESTTDPAGNTVLNVYNSDGTLHSASAGGSDMAVTLSYNTARMRDGIDDPDYGCMRYRHNAFGEVVEQITPKGTSTKCEYDALGRQTRRTMKPAGAPEEVTAWKYSTTKGHLGTLESIVFSDKQKIAYRYDDMQRVIRSEETFDGETYESSYTYDVFGRLSTETYPSGVSVTNKYNGGGYLYAVKNSGGDVIWKADGYDVYGHITDFRTGNGLTTHHEYDDRTGRLLGITTRSDKKIFQDYAYTYDDFGNFASRKKRIGKMPEDIFTYDNLNRLTKVETNGVPFKIDYDGYGRILTKEQEGFSFRNASFDREHPHAVSRVEAYRRPAFGGQDVTYTPFDKVETVTADGIDVRLEYGHDRQRIRMTEKSDKGVMVKTYIGNCEFVTDDGAEKVLTYLCAGSGVFAVAESTAGGCRMHYVHTDHLGSWDIITDEEGRLEQELSFDAWGNRRNAATWQGEATDEPMFDRGFTGHEHLYAFGLINMNGRVYDPLMSSFLSPDNFIQCPDNSQNFNRYAYCLNNPLRFTDPSGEVFTELLIAAAVGAVINVACQGLAGNITDCGDVFAAMGVGALAGLVGGAVGSGISSAIAGTGFGCGLIGAGSTATTSFASGAAIGAGAGFSGGFITGCGNAWINGASFGDGLVSGLKSGLVGGLTGGLVGGVSGGISAAMDGRNFWNGDKVIVAERKYPTGPDYMQPENSFDCVPTNAKVIDHYRGGNKTARYLRDNYWIKNSDPMESGLVSDQFYDLMAEGKNASFDVLYEDFNEECIFNSFKYHDADVAIDIPGRGGYHNVLLRKMECRVHHTWGSGAHDIISYKSWIQDPATGYVNSNIFDFSLVKKICLLYY